MKRVFRYIAGPLCTAIVYKAVPDGAVNLVRFSDLDWIECETDKKQTIGFVFFWCRRCRLIGIRGAVCRYHVQCWGWILCHGLCSAGEEGIKILLLLTFGTVKCVGKPKVCVDNRRAIKMSKNDAIGYNTTHIEPKYHLVCGVLNRKKFKLEHCPSNDIVPDMVTKPFGQLMFQKCYLSLGLQNS